MYNVHIVFMCIYIYILQIYSIHTVQYNMFLMQIGSDRFHIFLTPQLLISTLSTPPSGYIICRK